PERADCGPGVASRLHLDTIAQVFAHRSRELSLGRALPYVLGHIPSSNRAATITTPQLQRFQLGQRVFPVIIRRLPHTATSLRFSKRAPGEQRNWVPSPMHAP